MSSPNTDGGNERQPARYIVGIDLGTTNSAVAYVDVEHSAGRIEVFPVPQLVAPGQIEALEVLPSSHYEPLPDELGHGLLRLPWSSDEASHVVGVFARDQGARTPGRLIASAKSWLCHSGVDRTARLLPWHGAADVERLSPVEASARYLAHLRQAWDHRFAQYPLAEQDVVLTLPASFDEVARELTVKAAALAGLPRVVLIEEPQAAFYAWIYLQGDGWHQQVQPGQKILVCDIGGGTTDLTLIRVRQSADGKIQFHRVAVGEHLILGGDNMDLTLAHHLEKRLGAGKLPPAQWAVLVRACQQAKEQLLGQDAPEQLTVNLPGSGSRVIGGAVQVALGRAEAESILVDGFFPFVELEEKPARRSGFQEFGLPYAADAAVPRYLAAFLTTHRHVDAGDQAGAHDPARPDIVLLNGGVFTAPRLRQRLVEVVSRWFRTPAQPDWQPIVLAGDRLDLAVARGAAYYGLVRRGMGVRIAAGLARTYYVGVSLSPAAAARESAEVLPAASEPPSAFHPTAVCLVPAGIEPGCDVELQDPAFELAVSQPVEFPLYVSSTRLTDRPGQLVPADPEQLRALPPIRTVLQTRKKEQAGRVPVHLHARLTEIGTLELWCRQTEGKRTWRLQFDVRSATRTDVAAHTSDAEREGFVDEACLEQCARLIDATFGPQGTDSPEGLTKRLARAIGASRDLWPTSVLRRLWEMLIEHEPGRRRGHVHEARWINLLGFSLRPGYGMAMDDWRVAETWRRLQGNLVHPTTMCRIEWFIFWRRIGGGLSAGQQQALAEPLVAIIRSAERRSGGQRAPSLRFAVQETAEIWRMLGNLELLPVATKIELGAALCKLLAKHNSPLQAAALWALARLGARSPVYGPLNCVVPPETAWQWLQALLKWHDADPLLAFAVMQLARRTDDRYRDLADKQRNAVLGWLRRSGASEHLVELVERGGLLDREEQKLVFGDSLPAGLYIA